MKLSDYTEVTEITKGWSGDKKYCVTDSTGRKYLLRISPAEQYDTKKTEFECMQQVAALGINMCRPVEFGRCDEGVYSLQTWIDGKDAEEVLSDLSDRQVYDYGCEAGRILRKIHSIPAPSDILDWETFFNGKMDRKIKMYRECPLKYENGDVFIEYIESQRHLLKNRPQTYQHGDYHIGNLMIDSEGRIAVIDFNRRDYGDPWEEFNRIVWCAQSAPLFACGMVDGYFDGEVPMDFWNLLALYIASNTLSSLPWAIPFGQGEIDTMINQAKDILEWYDGMKRTVPGWYTKPNAEKPKVAFVCVHNSCRSQMAEALGKKLASDVFESYSAGTELKDHINPDAVRLMKKLHDIDMEQTQYNKLLADIPEPDVVIFMGCNVSCPIMPSQYSENWGLDDPSGQSDEVFAETIRKIEENVLKLKETLKDF